jgi:Flp pilus assembly pilin Flp
VKTALRFLKEESGQDLIEYTLLIAFIAMGSAALFLNVGQSTEPIWSNASTQLINAAAAAGSHH